MIEIICQKCKKKRRNAGHMLCQVCYNHYWRKNNLKTYKEIRHKSYIKIKATDNDRLLRYARNTQMRLKSKIMAAYGGKCACCGEPNEKFLTLNRIKNNDEIKCGRKFKGNGTNVGVYRQAIKEKCSAAFQLLCWNCSYGTAKNGGVCPHKNNAIASSKIKTAH